MPSKIISHISVIEQQSSAVQHESHPQSPQSPQPSQPPQPQSPQSPQSQSAIRRLRFFSDGRHNRHCESN